MTNKAILILLLIFLFSNNVLAKQWHGLIFVDPDKSETKNSKNYEGSTYINKHLVTATVDEDKLFYRVRVAIKNNGSNTLTAPQKLVLQDGDGLLFKYVPPEQLISFIKNQSYGLVPPPVNHSVQSQNYEFQANSVSNGNMTSTTGTLTSAPSSFTTFNQGMNDLAYAIAMKRQANAQAMAQSNILRLSTESLRPTAIPPGATYSGVAFFSKLTSPSEVKLTINLDNINSSALAFKKKSRSNRKR